MGILPFTVLHSADASFYTNARSAATLLSSKSIGALIPTAFAHFVFGNAHGISNPPKKMMAY